MGLSAIIRQIIELFLFERPTGLILSRFCGYFLDFLARIVWRPIRSGRLIHVSHATFKLSCFVSDIFLWYLYIWAISVVCAQLNLILSRMIPNLILIPKLHFFQTTPVKLHIHHLQVHILFRPSSGRWLMRGLYSESENKPPSNAINLRIEFRHFKYCAD